MSSVVNTREQNIMHFQSSLCHVWASPDKRWQPCLRRRIFAAVDWSTKPIRLKAKLCVFIMYALGNLPELEHKSKSLIWGRLTLCGEFNTLFFFFYKRSNPHPHRTSAKHTHGLMNGHVSYIYTLSHTYTSGRAGAGQADWNYQARPWALSTNFQRKQILDATLIFPFNTD